MAAALAGAKAKKKKWNKGKMREKLNSKVLFDEDGWARLLAEVPKMKLVTPSGLCRANILCWRRAFVDGRTL